MSQRERTLWCPACGETTANAPVPQMASDQELIGKLASPSDPRGFFRRRYCLACQTIWRSVEVPVEFMEELLALRPKVEDLKRQVATLRLLLAHERQQQATDRRAA